MGYIDKSGGYYVGDRQGDDLAVPDRPSALHVWRGGVWVLDIAANLQWKTTDGSFITMTQTLAQQVFGAVAANDQTIFAAAETHRVAMEASADPASYDYSGGWPKIYGE